MAEPDLPIRVWANTPTEDPVTHFLNTQEPSADYLAVGFKNKDFVPRQALNWFLKMVGLWLTYFRTENIDRKAEIAGEAGIREEADNALQGNINNEITDRQNAITAEATTRANADTAEATTRASADTALTAAIAALGTGASISLMSSITANGGGSFTPSFAFAVVGRIGKKLFVDFSITGSCSGTVTSLDVDITGYPDFVQSFGTALNDYSGAVEFIPYAVRVSSATKINIYVSSGATGFAGGVQTITGHIVVNLT